MKTRHFTLFMVLLFVGTNFFAKENEDDTSLQHQTDKAEALVKKEAAVNDKAALFHEKQQQFDAVAEELHAARVEYLKELSESTAPLLQEMLDLSERFSERASLVAPLANQYVTNVDAIRQELEQLNEGVIGVYLQPEVAGGVLISEVIKEGPAATAGLQSGDVIVRVDDTDITVVETPIETTTTIIKDKGAGDSVRLKIKRGGNHLSYDVETVDRLTLNSLDARSQQWLSQNRPMRVSTFGTPGLLPSASYATALNTYALAQRTNKSVHVMEIEEDLGQYFDVEYGVLVLKADDVESLHPGDILLSIDERPVRSLSHARRHLRAADEEVEIRLKRKKRQHTITVERDNIRLNAILQ